MKTLNPFRLLQNNFDKVLKLCQSSANKQLQLLAIFILLLTGLTTKAQTQLYTVIVGDTVVLSVTGTTATIQWQQSTDSITWADIPNATTNPYEYITTASATGKRFFRATTIDNTLCGNHIIKSSIVRNNVITSTTEVQVGDWFHGGIVFYTDGTGHGLIAPQQDQSPSEWGCQGTSIPGAVSTTDGAANTAAIVAACSTRPIAASVCDTLTLNGYSDWFLPAKEQLNYLYQQQSLVGGFSVYYYWSSSVGGVSVPTGAWGQNFSSGSQYGYSTLNTYYVRCVRSF